MRNACGYWESISFLSIKLWVALIEYSQKPQAERSWAPLHKRGQKEFMTICNGLLGQGSANNCSLFFAGCFLVTSWLSWQLELYPWHSVVCNSPVLSPLHCGWSSIGKSSSFFFFLLFLIGSVGLEIVIFLFLLYLSKLFKKRTLKRELVVFFLQTLPPPPLSLTILLPVFTSRSVTSLYTPLLSTCWHHQERIVSREEEFSLSAAISLHGV